jgi:hypothetical protein
MGTQKKKIGEILIENGLVSKAILDDALLYQAKFGGSVTQYLIAHEYIKEEDLAKCISTQFGYPYLPLRAYDIPEYIVRLIPADIAQKYLLMPVDKIENIITLVMSNPFDEEGISEIEKITGCKVQPFVSIISDIVKAIEKYYGIHVKYVQPTKGKSKAPLFIVNNDYVGAERRKSVRIKAGIEIHFPLQDTYKKTKTKDVSGHGFLFESSNILPVGSYLTIEVNLPKGLNAYPPVGVVQVVRAVPLDNGKFDIGVKLIEMAKESIDKITRHAIALNQLKNNR